MELRLFGITVLFRELTEMMPMKALGIILGHSEVPFYRTSSQEAETTYQLKQKWFSKHMFYKRITDWETKMNMV